MYPAGFQRLTVRLAALLQHALLGAVAHLRNIT
jgi:hypothetical protein